MTVSPLVRCGSVHTHLEVKCVCKVSETIGSHGSVQGLCSTVYVVNSVLLCLCPYLGVSLRTYEASVWMWFLCGPVTRQ